MGLLSGRAFRQRTETAEGPKFLARGSAVATKAYILIETAVGKTREVAQALRKVEGMQSVDVVTGPYDIIALLEARDITIIGDLVTEHVHFAGVVRTVTCISVGGS